MSMIRDALFGGYRCNQTENGAIFCQARSHAKRISFWMKGMISECGEKGTEEGGAHRNNPVYQYHLSRRPNRTDLLRLCRVDRRL